MKLFSSEELRLYRAKLNITQKELAIRTGYSISYIQKLEQGHLEVTQEFMQRLFRLITWKQTFGAVMSDHTRKNLIGAGLYAT